MSDNPVRVIDAFVEKLDLIEDWDLRGWSPRRRADLHIIPSVLLKLYIYGYLNRVQSSRRLEREAGRNVEVMWLTGRLNPDHKTIADFRKDSGASDQAGLRAIYRTMPPDGSAHDRRALRLMAASSRRSITATRTSRAIRWSGAATQLEESVARYLAQLDTADRQEPSEELAAKTSI